jgi:hypothetical protein
MNATGSKIVNLYVGVNEPEAAIAALPSSHSIDLVVNV